MEYFSIALLLQYIIDSIQTVVAGSPLARGLLAIEESTVLSLTSAYAARTSIYYNYYFVNEII